MKSTKMQTPRCNKCSAVVEKNCPVAEYRAPYRIGLRIVIRIKCRERSRSVMTSGSHKVLTQSRRASCAMPRPQMTAERAVYKNYVSK